MDKEQKTIDAFWPAAREVGRHLQKHHTASRAADPKWFSPHHWDGNNYLSAAFVKPGVIEYRLNHSADIQILNVKPAGVKAGDIDIGPIEPTGPQKTVRASVMNTRNSTTENIQRTLTYRDLQSQTHAATVAKEVGASISAGLRQSIGYGSEVAQIQGETEITLNIEASVKAAWEDVMTAHREFEVTSERELIEKALCHTVIERVETVGPARQVIKVRGELSYGVRIHSSGYWWLSFDNISDFIAMAKGIYPQSAAVSTNDGRFEWPNWYRNYPVPRDQLALLGQNVYAEVEHIREFDNVSNINLDIKSTPMSDSARMKEALELIVLTSKNEELKKLAKAELEKD